MKNDSRERQWKQRPEHTVGVDLGDRFSRYCVLNREGEVIEEGRIRTHEEGFRRQWEGEPRQRIGAGNGNAFALDQPSVAGFGS